MNWDRFDICEAYNLLAHDWGLYDVKARLDAIPFKSSASAEFYNGLSVNGRDIYDYHTTLLETRDSTIRSIYV